MNTENFDIDFNGSVKITGFITWMDGGTVELKCRDQHGKEFLIEISQRMFIEKNDFKNLKKVKLPGRIYLNGECVLPRSELENRLLKCLQKIEYPESITLDLDKRIIEESIAFIQSEDYLKLFDKTQKWD